MPRSEVTVGRDERWGWDAPAPLEAGSTPTLEIRSASDVWAPPLTAQRAPFTVNEIDDDRTTLTATAPLAAIDRTAGEDGDAWLIAADGQVVEMRVGRSQGAAVHLATPLPREVIVDATNPATIQLRRWSADLVAEEEDESPGPTAAAAHLNWRVSYSAIGSGGVAEARVDSEVLRVVPGRFCTGLTLVRLRRHVPVAAYREGRRASLQGLVDSALDELVAHIESKLPRTLDVSAILNGRDFEGPHAQLTRARLPKVGLDEEQALRMQAFEWADKLIARILRDVDGDGVPDPPPRSQRRHLDFGGGGLPTTDRVFKRGMRR